VAVGLLFGATAPAAAGAVLIILAVAAVRAGVRMARPRAGPAELSAVVGTVMLGGPAVAVLVPADRGDLVHWLATLSPGRLIAVGVLAGGLAGVAARAGRDPAPVTRRPAPAQGAPAAQAPAAQAPAARPPAPSPRLRAGPRLSIGMATYDDFDGVYFTVQALRLYHDLADTELIVVDNFGCAHTREFVRSWVGGTYVRATDVVGTAAARDRIFECARGAAVLCCDSHVLFAPGVVARLRRFHQDHPDCPDLLQGPLVYDDGRLVSTHFEPVWRDQMWGVWATDPRGDDPAAEPFDIPMQGLGVFSCRTDAWPGFSSGFRGFGGEEGYIHEKFRRAGGRCLCLPWLRWMHRFGRPRGVPYPLTVEDKLHNYLVGHAELGLDPEPVIAHFGQYLSRDRIADVVSAAGASRTSGGRTARR
jgi:hypothetical protein